MNKDTLQGDWNVAKRKIKERWSKLTDEDLAEIKGKREQLLGKLQKKCGLAKDKAEQELAEWERRWEQECKSHECKSHECKSHDTKSKEQNTRVKEAFSKTTNHY